MASWRARKLQAMESHLQKLRRVTMDVSGNSVLSNAVTLDSLVPITRNLPEAQLRQCVINALRNATYRLCKGAEHPEGLSKDVLFTMADFQKALEEMNI